MKVSELLSRIDSFAPFSLAEEWDNPGLMSGSLNSEVNHAAIALDAAREAVIEADARGCEVLVCHHPLIFRPVKRIDTDSEPGRTIAEAIKRNITIIAAHTNWDRAEGGVNDTLARLLGLKDTEPLDEEGGFGVKGTLPQRMKPLEFADMVKSSWCLSRADIYAVNLPEYISRVALCGGSGASFWTKALDADVYITADMKYHELIDANTAGLAVMVVDHGEMERASLPELAKKISCPELEAVILDTKALTSPLRV